MFDYKDLEDRLIAIGFDDDHPDGQKIRETLLAVAVTIDHYDLSEIGMEAVSELISAAGRRRLREVPQSVLNGSDWEDFAYGNIKVGDFVRVKRDAYDSPTGIVHNGLVGILGFVSGRRCTVNYIGLQSGTTLRHPMDKLESLKIR